MRRLVFLGSVLAMACGGKGEDAKSTIPDSDAGAETSVDSGLPETGKPDVQQEAGPDVADDAQQDAPPIETCVSNQSFCLDHQTRKYCEGGQWKEQTCAEGHGCVGGQCVSGACSDACRLGDTQGGKTCEVYDVIQDAWLTPEPETYLHDRARAYEMWLHRDGMAFGGVGSARYADPPEYTNVEYLDGLGDSAIWTGTYLASEALRLKATGAADARKNVVDLVDTLHLWFNVSGDPGMLARFVAPSNQPHPTQLGDLDCSAKRCHCNVTYDGVQYDYIGHISRDQYQGVMLGYALAYEALGEHEEATRGRIRKDVVDFMQELMTERTVPMKVMVNGTPVGPLNVKMRFSVINTAELDNGAVSLVVDTNNYNDAEMYGFQEFIPNLALILKQIPLISAIVPATVPRADSAVMLASFFNVAFMVTDGVDAYEAQRDEMLAFYEANIESGGNINDWYPIMTGWSYTNNCGDKYYANNIVMQPMYNLVRLEIDLVRRGIIRSHVLDAQMWAEFETTKNSFFSYIYSAVVPGSAAGIHQDATAQLSQFPPPPRVKVPVDRTTDPKYLPHQGGCPNQTSHGGAVDVGERVVSDFLWQRHPWGLLDAGSLAKTYPGIDYLVAYWMGRHHGYIPDDTVGRCTAWR